jgi:multiple sugar transport system permease protein
MADIRTKSDAHRSAEGAVQMTPAEAGGRGSYVLLHKARPYILVLPALLLTIGVLIPFINGVYWSLTNYNLMHPAFKFIGIRNYLTMFRDSNFWNTLRVTAVYVVAAVGSELVLGLAIAMLLNRETVAAKICRPLLVLPLLTAPVLATLMWKLMLSSEYGIVNYFLSLIVPSLRDFPWAGSAHYAMLTVVVIDVWIFTPFIALLLLAGMRSLPAAPFEAARVDGASPWFAFRQLTWPMLTPYLVVALIFRIIDTIQQFDIPYVLTEGGPGDALMTMQVRAYTQSFTYLNIGIGSAYMFVTWAIVFIISRLMVNLWTKWRAKLGG